MARSHLVNAVDVALAADVPGAAAEITVDDASVLPVVPFYLVIDPFSETGREYCRCTSVTGDVLAVERNLDGSESTTHSSGDVVRISYVAQILDDVWNNFSSYLPLSGGTMTGMIQFAYPQSTGHARIAVTDAPDRRIVTLSASDISASNSMSFQIYAIDDASLPGGGYFFRDSAAATLFSVRPGGLDSLVDLDMNSHKIISLLDPSSPQEAATKAYVDGFLPLSGGVMTGDIDMADNSIIGMNRIRFDYQQSTGYTLMLTTNAPDRRLFQIFAYDSAIAGYTSLNLYGPDDPSFPGGGLVVNEAGGVSLLRIDTNEIIMYKPLDMHGNNIVGVGTIIRGTAGQTLSIQHGGAGAVPNNHRINLLDGGNIQFLNGSGGESLLWNNDVSRWQFKTTLEVYSSGDQKIAIGPNDINAYTDLVMNYKSVKSALNYEFYTAVGGWARGLIARDNAGTTELGGVYLGGNADVMSYVRLGSSYGDPKAFGWYPDGDVVINGQTHIEKGITLFRDAEGAVLRMDEGYTQQFLMRHGWTDGIGDWLTLAAPGNGNGNTSLALRILGSGHVQVGQTPRMGSHVRNVSHSNEGPPADMQPGDIHFQY